MSSPKKYDDDRPNILKVGSSELVLVLRVAEICKLVKLGTSRLREESDSIDDTETALSNRGVLSAYTQTRLYHLSSLYEFQSA